MQYNAKLTIVLGHKIHLKSKLLLFPANNVRGGFEY